MALSQDEQRVLAEIERRLAAEDPGLAARLSSFKRPVSAVKFRSPRSRIIGLVFATAAAVALSAMIYAMIPFRAHAPRGATNPQATGAVSASAPAKPASKPAAASSAAGSPAASKATSPAKVTYSGPTMSSPVTSSAAKPRP